MAKMEDIDVNARAAEALEVIADLDIPRILEAVELSASTIKKPIGDELSALEQANPDTLYPTAADLHRASLTMPDAIRTIREFSESLKKFAETGEA